MKLNTNVYIKNILIPASQAMKKHFRNENFTFQQDSAPSHTSKKNSSMVQSQFSEFLEQGNVAASPDLNPLDFNVWLILEAGACAKTHDIVKGLKVSLKKA